MNVEYYINPKTHDLVSLNTETKEITVLEKVTRGGGLPLKKEKKYKKSDDPDAPFINRKSKLDPEKRNKVIELLNTGISVAEIVEQTGVSNPTIYKIKNSL